MPYPALLSLLACLAALPGQARQGDFVCAAPASANPPTKGGLLLVDPVAGTATDLKATGGLANSHCVACDPFVDDILWVGTMQASTTSAPAIYRVRATGGRILASTEIMIGLTAVDGAVMQLRRVGEDVMFLTHRQLSLVSKAGGTPRVLRSFGGTADRATGFATNGRDVFLRMRGASTAQADRIDWFHIEQTTANPYTIYTAPRAGARISSLCLEQDRNPLLVETDSSTSTSDLKLLDPVGQLVRRFPLPFPDGGVGARADDKTGVILVTGLRFDPGRNLLLTELISLRDWSLLRSSFGTTTEGFTGIDVRRHAPLHRHGHACLSAVSQQRLSMAAHGLPEPGNGAYTVSLAGPRNRPALLLVGLHGQLSNPLSLAPMGAGTCVLGVQPLVQIGVWLPQSGFAEFKAPIPANSPTGIVDVQWLVAEPSANRAGLLSSQVGSIVVR